MHYNRNNHAGNVFLGQLIGGFMAVMWIQSSYWMEQCLHPTRLGHSTTSCKSTRPFMASHMDFFTKTMNRTHPNRPPREPATISTRHLQQWKEPAPPPRPWTREPSTTRMRWTHSRATQVMRRQHQLVSMPVQERTRRQRPIRDNRPSTWEFLHTSLPHRSSVSRVLTRASLHTIARLLSNADKWLRTPQVSEF